MSIRRLIHIEHRHDEVFLIKNIILSKATVNQKLNYIFYKIYFIIKYISITFQLHGSESNFIRILKPEKNLLSATVLVRFILNHANFGGPPDFMSPIALKKRNM